MCAVFKLFRKKQQGGGGETNPASPLNRDRVKWRLLESQIE